MSLTVEAETEEIEGAQPQAAPSGAVLLGQARAGELHERVAQWFRREREWLALRDGEDCLFGLGSRFDANGSQGAKLLIGNIRYRSQSRTSLVVPVPRLDPGFAQGLTRTDPTGAKESHLSPCLIRTRRS